MAVSDPEIYTDEDRAFFRSMGGVPHKSIRENVEVWFFGETPEEESPESGAEYAPISEFAQAHAELLGTGAGQVRLLYQAARRVLGQNLDIGPQEWVDCVSWGFGGAVDLRACVEVEEERTESYDWTGRVCTEALQALAAYEYNSKKGWTNSRRAAVAVRDGGTLSRRVLGEYDPKRAEKWASSGLPDEHEDDAQEHQIRDISRVRNFDEARAAIFNGFPIAIGGSQGFKNNGQRDQHGFAAASTNEWLHCMKFIAMRDDERPGLLCMNSWSPNSGPRGQFPDIPDGSFWVTKETCNNMFASGAGFAVGAFEGYVAT